MSNRLSSHITNHHLWSVMTQGESDVTWFAAFSISFFFWRDSFSNSVWSRLTFGRAYFRYDSLRQSELYEIDAGPESSGELIPTTFPKQSKLGSLFSLCLILAICPEQKKEIPTSVQHKNIILRFDLSCWCKICKVDINMMMILSRVGALKVWFLWPSHLHFSTILPLALRQN